MRRTLVLLLALGVVGFGIPIDFQILTSSTTAQSPGAPPKPFSLRIAAANGKAAANLPVFTSMSPTATPIGTTGPQGDILLAADPNKFGKSFNVYRVDCSKIVYIEAGTPEDNACKAQHDPNLPPDRCGRCQLLGGFIFGQSSTVGQFSGGNPFTNPWVLGPLIGGGVAVPVIVNQSGSSNASSTSTPTAGTPTTGTPPAQPNPPAPPPPPTSFTATNAPQTFTATQSGTRTCNLIAPNYTGSGNVTVDSSGRYVINATDATGITQVITGTGAFTGGTTLTSATSQMFPFTSASGRMYQVVATDIRISSDGTFSYRLTITYIGGGPAGPPAGCGDSFTVTGTFARS